MKDNYSSKRKFFMIFVCMLMQAIPFGVAQNIQPLFIPYVVDDFGFSLGAFCLIFTFGALASSIFSPFLGKVFGKVNIKIIFIIGTALSSFGFFGFGIAKTLPEFYLYSAVSQIGCVFFSGLGIPYVINNWFPKKGRGRALGIAFAGGSIGNVFLQKITSYLLDVKGASTSYLIFGIFSFIFSLLIILPFIRMPKDNEIDSEDEYVNNDKKKVVFEGHGAKETRKNKYFWIYSVGYGIIAIAISALSTQYATYFGKELQLSSSLIGTLGSTFAAFCLIGNVGGGALFDKLGSFKTMSIAMVLKIIAICGMLLAKDYHNFAFLFSISYGMCVYSYMSGPAFMATDVFGKKDSSVNLGLISLVFAVGFALGSTLFGAVVDILGFKVAWLVMIACVIIGYSMLLTSIKVIKKQNESYTNENKFLV